MAIGAATLDVVDVMRPIVRAELLAVHLKPGPAPDPSTARVVNLYHRAATHGGHDFHNDSQRCPFCPVFWVAHQTIVAELLIGA